MKKKLLFLCLGIGTSLLLSAQTFSESQIGQTTRKKIAVYVSSVLSEARNTALGDNLTEAFAESDKYIAVNRSREVYDLMKEAQAFQQSGYIDITQVANFTKGLGENQLCAVSVIRVGDDLVFRASIVEFTGETLKSTSYKYKSSYNDVPYDVIYTASQKLIEGLLGKPQQTTEPVQTSQSTKKNTNTRSDIAWGIAGTGYPWNLTSGIEWRWGGIVGFGLYGDIGMDFTYVDAYYYREKETKTSFKYAGGIKFYPYRGLFLDCGYGTICPAYVESKTYYESGHGVLFHVGYNLFFAAPTDNTGFFLGICGGASYNVINNKYAPSINLKIGISWISQKK